MKAYLAGPICDAKGASYIKWRQDLKDFLTKLNIQALDPTDKHQGHVGDVKNKLQVLRENGEFEKVKEFMEKFVLPSDKELVKQSDFIIAYVPEYSVGTSREIALAYEWNKPIYVVTPIKYPSNALIGMATKIFSTFDGLQNYLYRLYKDKA